MANNLDRVVSAVESMSSAGTLAQIVTRMSPRPTTRSMQRWLTTLVRKHRLIRTGGSTNTRYAVPRPATSGVDDFVGPDAAGMDANCVANAVRLLVRQPVAERPAAAYRHIFLDAYRPNITRYIAPELRAAIAGQLIGCAATLPPPEDLAAEFARFVCALEDPAARWSTDPDGPSPHRASEGERARNRANLRALDAAVRATFLKLLCEGGAVELCQETLLQFVEALPEDPFPNLHGVRRIEGEYVPLMRMESPSPAPWLTTSTYRPCQDGPQVEASLDLILAKSPAITDPVEQAFFALVHVAYLQPFRVLNATTACVAFNLPLLRAGLAPVTFAETSVRDFMDGMLGVWELNRIELLRDVVVRAVAATGKSAARPASRVTPSAPRAAPAPRPATAPTPPPTSAPVRQPATAFGASVVVPMQPPAVGSSWPSAPPVPSPVVQNRAVPVPPSVPKPTSAAAPVQPGVADLRPARAVQPPRAAPAPAPAAAPKAAVPMVDWTGATSDPQVVEAVQMTVSNQLGRVAAKSFVQTAAENHPNPKWFKAIVTAVLETLDEPHLPAFGLDSRTFRNWRQSWR